MNEEERKEKLDGDPSGDEIAAGPDNTTPAVEPEETETETDWKAEAEKNLNLYLLSQADMENMRKRLEREKADFLKFANERLIKELLPVLDNLERAMAHAPGDRNGEGVAEGVQMIYEGLLGSLERFGVGPVVAAGEAFDPNFHEAVMQRDDPDKENNTVLEVVQKGYLLNDRLIRPAMVIVSRRPSDEGRDGD